MDTFAAIADPVRRAILVEVARGPVRVVDLVARTHDQHPVSRPAISRHLRVLDEAGLVTAEDRGRERHYRIALTGLAPVQALIERLVLTGTPVTPQALDALATEVRRTSRDRRTSTPRQETA